MKLNCLYKFLTISTYSWSFPESFWDSDLNICKQTLFSKEHWRDSQLCHFVQLNTAISLKAVIASAAC